jgi:NAD(P)-dependent dehydrogenase (short-subunit alcohol dehydrogenase family)
MFVVLGASGNTGKVIAETLLRQKKKVRVVLHDAAKGKAWGEAGADVAIADVDERTALERAFSGAEGVYVLLPPNFSSSHVRVDNNRRTHTIAAAVEAAVFGMSSCSRPSALSNPMEPARCSASATQRLYSVEPTPPRRSSVRRTSWRTGVGRCTLLRRASFRHS